jgi:CheY-like chemotaxis protein
MNGIIGMTELALATNLTTDQREYLNAVMASSESLMRIINDILDFSRIEAGKLGFEDAAFDLRETLENALGVVSVQAKDKGIELICHVLPDVPPHVIADSGRLRQIIINLVGNAIKFTEEGEVVVRVSHESFNDGTAVLHFQIADTGIGIPRAKFEAIFSAFEQVDSSSTRRFGGTGLGLAISSRLVENMGGRIWVESEIGKGSVFHFTLPSRPSGVKQQEDEPERVFPEELTVLVVDDNETNLKVLEEILRSWGLNSDAATNGLDAVTMLKKGLENSRPYELLIVDGQMPGLDGFGTVQELRKQEALRDIPVIMMTSGPMFGDSDRAQRLGIKAFVTKPVKQKLLRELIRRVVGTFPSPEVTLESGEDASAGPMKRSLRILLVEDNPVNQKVATKMLQNLGHTVECAQNGREAVEANQDGKFDLVLMDVQMPVMDGHDATALIRKDEQGKGVRTPIVAMTAHAREEDRKKCLQSGMDDYISKPIDLKRLRAMIARLFS